MKGTGTTMRVDQVKEPAFLKICVGLILLGFLCMFAGNVIGGMMVPDYDAVADTISDLGAGKYAMIQDVAFYAYAMSLFILSMALAHAHTGGWKWTAGIFALAITGLLTILIGARNEYGDGDNEGVVLHIYFVYGLALMLFAAPLLLSSGLKKWGGAYRNTALLFAVAWLITAPIFFMLPTAYDGLWERGLGVLVTGWLSTLAFGLWRQSQ